MKNNIYFEDMKRIVCEWESARQERVARKQTIIDTYGRDSKELKAWHEEDAAAKFPFGNGACKAYRAWQSSVQYGEEELEMEDFLWDREVHGFIDTLRKAGIKAFVYTNQSTAVMENIHAFAAEGCTLAGLCKVTRKDKRWGGEEETTVMGIRFSLDCTCGYQEDSGEGKSNFSKELKPETVPDEPYAYVDGSYNIETGTPGYGGIVNYNGKFYPFAGTVSDESLYSMRNVAGEIYGAMAAVKTAEQLGLGKITLYYDYAGIEEWALGHWKRNKDGTKAYKTFMDNTKVEVHFKKVKGHSGIKGNEIADVLAKRAVGIGLTKKQAGILENLLSEGIL